MNTIEHKLMFGMMNSNLGYVLSWFENWSVILGPIY